MAEGAIKAATLELQQMYCRTVEEMEDKYFKELIAKGTEWLDKASNGASLARPPPVGSAALRCFPSSGVWFISWARF